MQIELFVDSRAFFSCLLALLNHSQEVLTSDVVCTPRRVEEQSLTLASCLCPHSVLRTTTRQIVR
jgi:hypothetical protein